MKIGFIGAGKVGFSLGKYFSEHDSVITGYYSQNPESARDASEFTNSRQYLNIAELIYESDIVFITVPDNMIKSIYQEIRKFNISEKQICHCSGVMTASEAFPDIRKYNAYGYSIHPLFPVSNKYDSYTELKNAFFCLEGDKTYLEQWENFFRKLGNPVRIISAETKNKYHTACTIASNLVCALMAESFSLMQQCGFTEEQARNAIKPLAISNINHIFETDPVTAMTGAVERNDTATVMKHLTCISSESDHEIYRYASLKLTELAQKKHPDTDYSNMKQILLSDFPATKKENL